MSAMRRLGNPFPRRGIIFYAPIFGARNGKSVLEIANGKRIRYILTNQMAV
jgi:hypothetical protein